MIQSFKGHSRSHGTIANNRYYISIFFFFVFGSYSHAHSGADGCRAVAHTKGIVLTLTSFWKPADAFVFAVGVKNLFSTCKNFVTISLMAHVPNQLIVRRIVNVMQGNGHLYHPQTCTKMPPFF